VEKILNGFKKENGFSWVEVRDKNVQLNRCDVERIRNLANKLGIRIHYAWDSNDMLKAGNDAVYKKAIGNAIAEITGAIK
jgi:hypothetical protein